MKELVRHFLTLAMRKAGYMRHKLFWRDGFRCPFTGLSFGPPGRYLVARAAHILPFSFHNKVCMMALRVMSVQVFNT